MPAVEIEAAVMEQVKEALSTAAICVGILDAVKSIDASLPANHQDPLDEATVVAALNRLGKV